MFDFSDTSLDDFLAVRAVMPREDRLSLVQPVVTRRWDAFLLAFHITKQDVPVFFWIGLLATGAMAGHLMLRIVLLLTRSGV